MKKVSISIDEIAELKMKAVKQKFRYKDWSDFTLKMLDKEYEKIAR